MVPAFGMLQRGTSGSSGSTEGTGRTGRSVVSWDVLCHQELTLHAAEPCVLGSCEGALGLSLAAVSRKIAVMPFLQADKETASLLGTL